MIQTPPPAYHARRAGSPVLLVLCAAGGLAVLAAVHLAVLGLRDVVGTSGTGSEWMIYVPYALTGLALVYWRLAQRQAWFVLLLVGAVAAFATMLLMVAPDLFAEWMRDPYVLLYTSCRPLVLVGTLALGTLLWRSHRPNAGAVVIGAALVVPMLASSLGIILGAGGQPVILAVIGLVCAAASIGLVIVTRVNGRAVRTDEPAPRPSWAVTIGGAVAALAPVLFLVWEMPDSGESDFYTAYGQHMLIVGLIVLAVGVIAGIAAGPRVLTTGAAAGLLLGAVSGLAGLAMAEVSDLPVALILTVSVLSLAAGIAVGVLRARLVVGLAGLGVLVVWLLVLYLVFLADEPIFDSDVMNVLTPILLVITIIATMAVFATQGALLAPLGESPAGFAGVAMAVSAGSNGVVQYFGYHPPEDKPMVIGIYPPALVLIALAAGLTIVAHQRWHRAEPPNQQGPAEAVPAGMLGPDQPTDEVS